jgi:predicted TIM-barrel fold metal-dependent hydrolase
MLRPNMPYPEDEEGELIPVGLPAIIDTHVHVFPSNIFSAVWKWFDKNAWHIRYQMNSVQIIEFLLSRGVQHVVALQYAHKPGIARQLNTYMSELCSKYNQRVTGMATVYPGEDNGERILQEAFDAGLGGLKLHAHVQCFDMNHESMDVLYECCQFNQKPIVMHVGREPKSTAYNCDPYQLCNAGKLELILKDFPNLKICVPHLGFDESVQYQMLVEKYDNLWLDTAMVISDYFTFKDKVPLNRYRADRIMYGSDFPNIPFAWDRELKVLLAEDVPTDSLQRITNKNAADFFNI